MPTIYVPRTGGSTLILTITAQVTVTPLTPVVATARDGIVKATARDGVVVASCRDGIVKARGH